MLNKRFNWALNRTRNLILPVSLCLNLILALLTVSKSNCHKILPSEVEGSEVEGSEVEGSEVEPVEGLLSPFHLNLFAP